MTQRTYTPNAIIAMIQEDAPCVYDILRECYFEEMGDFPAPPTDDELLEQLTEYSWNNWDVHYWSGRYAQILEHNKLNEVPVRVPFTEEDLNDLQEWEHFHWTFDGVPLFIFNTESTPWFDPDSDEYNPSREV